MYNNFQGKSYNNNNYNSNSNNRNKQDFKSQLIDLKFKKEGYWDNKGNIREDLLTIEAKEVAQSFKNGGVTNSQLRAFFNEIKGLSNRIDGKKENWGKVYPMVLMIKSKIEYRCSKDRKMEALKHFLMNSVAYIQKENRADKGYEAFETFVVFFETVVGYSYGLGIK